MGGVDAEGTPNTLARGLEAIHEVGPGVGLAATAASYFFGTEVAPSPLLVIGYDQFTRHAPSVRGFLPTAETKVPIPFETGT